MQLDAFDTRLVPHLSARVTYISADRLEERTNMGAMPYYLCYVEIDPESLKKEQVYLSPACRPRCSSPRKNAPFSSTCWNPC